MFCNQHTVEISIYAQKMWFDVYGQLELEFYQKIIEMLFIHHTL